MPKLPTVQTLFMNVRSDLILFSLLLGACSGAEFAGSGASSATDGNDQKNTEQPSDVAGGFGLTCNSSDSTISTDVLIGCTFASKTDGAKFNDSTNIKLLVSVKNSGSDLPVTMSAAADPQNFSFSVPKEEIQNITIRSTFVDPSNGNKTLTDIAENLSNVLLSTSAPPPQATSCSISVARTAQDTCRVSINSSGGPATASYPKIARQEAGQNWDTERTVPAVGYLDLPCNNQKDTYFAGVIVGQNGNGNRVMCAGTGVDSNGILSISKTGVCTPSDMETQSCAVANGTGEQNRTCSNTGSWGSFGTCSAISCDVGFNWNAGSCVAPPTWVDVTTTTSGAPSNCAADQGRCTKKLSDSTLWWGKVYAGVTHNGAQQSCNGLSHNGKSNWRLPTYNELLAMCQTMPWPFAMNNNSVAQQAFFHTSTPGWTAGMYFMIGFGRDPQGSSYCNGQGQAEPNAFSSQITMKQICVHD